MRKIRQDVWDKCKSQKEQTDLFDAQLDAMEARHLANIGRTGSALESSVQSLEALIIVLANRVEALEGKK